MVSESESAPGEHAPETVWAISEGQRPQNTAGSLYRLGVEPIQWEDYSNYFGAGAEISRTGPLATFGIL